MESINEVQELTFGQKACGLTFNPGNNPRVNKIKQLSADLIDAVMQQMQDDSKKSEIAQHLIADQYSGVDISQEDRKKAYIESSKVGHNVAEKADQYRIAIRHIQEAQMWIVKGITWQY